MVDPPPENRRRVILVAAQAAREQRVLRLANAAAAREPALATSGGSPCPPLGSLCLRSPHHPVLPRGRPPATVLHPQGELAGDFVSSPPPDPPKGEGEPTSSVSRYRTPELLSARELPAPTPPAPPRRRDVHAHSRSRRGREARGGHLVYSADEFCCSTAAPRRTWECKCEEWRQRRGEEGREKKSTEEEGEREEGGREGRHDGRKGGRRLGRYGWMMMMMAMAMMMMMIMIMMIMMMS